MNNWLIQNSLKFLTGCFFLIFVMACRADNQKHR